MVTRRRRSGLKQRSTLWARLKELRKRPPTINNTTERAICPPIRMRRATELKDRLADAYERVVITALHASLTAMNAGARPERRTATSETMPTQIITRKSRRK